MAFRRTRKFSKKRKSTKRKTSKGVTKGVKRYVRRAIRRDQEDKMLVSDLVGAVSGDTQLIITSASSTLPQYYSLLPQINQNGTLMGRVGNRCKLTSCKVKVNLLLSGASITSAVDVPMDIYWFILQTRDSPDSINAADLNQLFYVYSAGAATTQFLSGSTYAGNHVINDDYFKVIAHNYNKPIKLGWSQYSSGGLFSNNDYKSHVRFTVDYTKHVQKLLHFNNSTSTALNHNWYMCFYVQKVNLDTTTTNWDPPQAGVTQILKFEDA